MDTKLHKRNINLDILRITACFFIVLAHVSSVGCENFPISDINWKLSHIFNSLGHSGTILFLFISGSLLLSEDYHFNVRKFYLGNFLTLLGAYISWLIIYHLVGMVQRGDYSPAVLKDAVLNIIYGNASYHFWYIPMLLGIYLLLPLFRAISRAGEKTVTYLVIFFLAVSVLFPTLFYFEFPYKYLLSSIVNRIPFTLVNHYVGYFFMGYLLSLLLREEKIPHTKLTGALLILLGSIGALLGDLALSAKTGYPSVSMNTLFSLTLCMIAAGVYLLICGLRLKEYPAASSLLTRISGLTFGIYMLHPLVITQVMKLTNGMEKLSSLLTVPLNTVLSFLCSLLISFLLSLIPGVRRWLLFLHKKRS